MSEINQENEANQIFFHIEDEISARWSDTLIGPYSLWYTPANCRPVWHGFIAMHGGLQPAKSYLTELFVALELNFGRSVGIDYMRLTGTPDLNNFPAKERVVSRLDRLVHGESEFVSPSDKKWFSTEYQLAKAGIKKC